MMANSDEPTTGSFPVLRQVVLDTTDARGLAEFYRKLLGYAYRAGDEPPEAGKDDERGHDWLVLRAPDGVTRVAFQQVSYLSQPTWPRDGVPQQLHLDMTVSDKKDLDAQHWRAVDLGARLLLDRSLRFCEYSGAKRDPKMHLNPEGAPAPRKGNRPMPTDLDANPGAAIELCQAAHARLLATLGKLTDDQARAPSRLPGWTVGHVLTHLARNADGHTRRLDGALRGRDVPRYQPGQRDADIAQGAGRPAEEIVADLQAAQDRLEAMWARSVAAGWPHRELVGDDHWETTGSPARRLREVEVHHVDLGLGYEPSDWPEDYVRWELPMVMATVPERARRPDDVRELVAWATGRGAAPTRVELGPW
jgi:maleylpyruvate isomerase